MGITNINFGWVYPITNQSWYICITNDGNFSQQTKQYHEKAHKHNEKSYQASIRVEDKECAEDEAEKKNF